MNKIKVLYKVTEAKKGMAFIRGQITLMQNQENGFQVLKDSLSKYRKSKPRTQ